MYQGIDFTHPDIADSFIPEGSYDMNNRKPLMPPDNENDSHGTRCAGQIVAKPNNSVCGVGVAFHANITGIFFCSVFRF